jgi:hypothetical protein
MDFLLSIKKENFNMRCCSRRCWSFDQQPNLEELLSIAEISLFQRFACWSKDQHGLSNFHHSPLPIHLSRRCWPFDQQPKLLVLLPIAEISLFQCFACWSKDQHGLSNN